MMHNFFEVKIRYEKVLEDGKNKLVTESYLLDALSFSEAEKRIIEEMKPYINGEFTVSAIKRSNYTEIFPCDNDKADKWYKVKLNLITLEERTGEEKKQAIYNLVQAESVDDSRIRFDEGMKGSVMDYEIESISETKIIEVYQFKS